MSHWGALAWQTAVDAGTGIRVYRLRGVLSDSSDSLALVAHMREAIRSDSRPVLLDVGELEHLTSTGIGNLATLCASAHNAQMAVALCGLSARTRLLLQIVHLLDIIKAFDSEQQALAAYAGGGWDAGAVR